MVFRKKRTYGCPEKILWLSGKKDLMVVREKILCCLSESEKKSEKSIVVFGRNEDNLLDMDVDMRI